MPQTYTSPLSERDMDLLEGMAAKANAHGRSEGHTPLYVAVDAGDARHQNGWLFISWPALNSSSAYCARLIFDFIGDVVAAEFGARMVATAPQDAPDGDKR